VKAISESEHPKLETNTKDQIKEYVDISIAEDTKRQLFKRFESDDENLGPEFQQALASCSIKLLEPPKSEKQGESMI